MDYIKHFNQQSASYLLFRPDYPEALFAYLLNFVNTPHRVWDCGTGNGQAAVALANYFEQVIATDISQAQLDVAPKHTKIRYLCCAAEKTSIKDNSVDLIVIAQALHWFNFDSFYQEVHRVGKKTGLIAAWCYSLGKFDSVVDNIINTLYSDILGDDYWPAERRYIDEQYQTIPFPFTKIKTPDFSIEKKMGFAQLLGYLQTWSAVKEYQKRNHINPLNLVFKELELAWGDLQHQYTIQWPLHLLVGRIASA